MNRGFCCVNGRWHRREAEDGLLTGSIAGELARYLLQWGGELRDH